MVLLAVVFAVLVGSWVIVRAQDNPDRPKINFDEDRVPQYVLPDPLVEEDGRVVGDRTAWRNRRADILAIYREQIYGRAPGKPQQLRFQLIERNPHALGGTATLKRIAIHSRQNGRRHRFILTLFTPNAPAAPVPVFLLLNHRSPALTDKTRKKTSPFWPVEMVIARGFGIAALQTDELAPDDRQRFRDGVIHLFEGDVAEADRAPDAWGALAAWSWGAQRAMDYFETDHRVNAKRVAVLGHSRGGKAALWTAAQDERFALAISNESGEVGAALSRRMFGETIARINQEFPYWFARNLQQYSGREDALPVDQHMLLSLIAPRALYVASAQKDLWSDPKGEFLSLAHASPVYALFGEPAIGTEEMPPLDQPLVRGKRGYHIRSGGHDMTLVDWDWYVDFAERLWR